MRSSWTNIDLPSDFQKDSIDAALVGSAYYKNGILRRFGRSQGMQGISVTGKSGNPVY
jgi:hypothetical protein